MAEGERICARDWNFDSTISLKLSNLLILIKNMIDLPKPISCKVYEYGVIGEKIWEK